MKVYSATTENEGYRRIEAYGTNLDDVKAVMQTSVKGEVVETAEVSYWEYSDWSLLADELFAELSGYR